MISTMEKRVIEMTTKKGNFENLSRVVRDSLNQKVTFDLGLEVDEGTSCTAVWRKNISGGSRTQTLWLEPFWCVGQQVG